MSVKLISVTPDAEKMMAYVARVSNPNNQENPNYAKLLVIVLNIIIGLYLSRHL